MGSLCLAVSHSLPLFMVRLSLHTEKPGKGTKCHTKSGLHTGYLSVHSSQPSCQWGRREDWLGTAGSVQGHLVLFTCSSRSFQLVFPALQQLILCALCGSPQVPLSMLSHWAVGFFSLSSFSSQIASRWEPGY